MSTGKQREILERDELFFRAARELLMNEGYQALTLVRVAEITGFSRGTLYQRFGSKEELIVALGLRCREKLLSAMQCVAQYDGAPRERMTAVGVAVEEYARQFPEEMRLLKIIHPDTILDRVPEEQRHRMKQYDVRMFGLLGGIVDDAIALGDLILSPDTSPHTFCIVLWAMVDGGFSAVLGGGPLIGEGLDEVMHDITRACQRLMDGYEWRPLYDEAGYREIARKVRATVFNGDSSAASDRPEGPRKNREGLIAV